MDNTEEYQRTNEIKLVDYVNVVLRGKKIIASVFILAIAATLVYTFLFTDKVYWIDTALEIGTTQDGIIEAPRQVLEKIDGDVYGVNIREILGISKKQYPKIKMEFPKDTSLIRVGTESSDTELAKSILGEINNLIIKEHDKKINLEKDLIGKNIETAQNNIIISQKAIDRVKAKIPFLEEEKRNLENKIEALQKVLVYQQDPGTQFALFDAKEKLESKKQEIENLYLEINNLEGTVNSLKNQITSLKKSIEDIQPTKVIKKPIVAEKPISPRPVLYSSIAALAGLVIGFILAFVKEWWKRNRVALGR